MRRVVRTVAGVIGAAAVAIACSFTSSGAGGPGSTPDQYEGGLLPDGNIAPSNGGNGTNTGTSNGSTGSPSNGSPSTGADI